MRSINLRNTQEAALEQICNHVIKNYDSTPCPTVFELVFEEKKGSSGSHHVAVYESLSAHESMMQCLNSGDYEKSCFEWPLAELADLCAKQVERKFVLGIFIAGYDRVEDAHGNKKLTLLVQGRTLEFYNDAKLGAEIYFSEKGGPARYRLRGDYIINKTQNTKPELKFTSSLDMFFAFYHLSVVDNKGDLIKKIKEHKI